MIQKLIYIFEFIKLRWYLHKLFKLPPSELKSRLWKAGYRPKIDNEVWTYDLGHSITFRIRHNQP